VSKILITGATGFVGQAVCKILREQGHMLTGTTRNADQGAGPACVPLYHIPSIGPDTDWSQAVSGADIVIHLAARVHVMKDRSRDPLAEFRAVNTAGTLTLARKAAAAGIKRFVFISTVKVAGEVSPAGGFSETASFAPEDPYGISKAEAEQGLMALAASSNMEVVILRPPLVYGPGVKGNFLALFNAINKTRPLPLGRIKNARSLIYVGNLADAVATTAIHPTAANQIFFVSDGEAVSTPGLISKIATSLDKKPRLINIPLGLLKLAGIMTGKSPTISRLIGSLEIDTAKIQSTTNWSPPYSMEVGLQETANWFNSNK
jgi:nucleoside-diphosphate-sugar epimerase